MGDAERRGALHRVRASEARHLSSDGTGDPGPCRGRASGTVGRPGAVGCRHDRSARRHPGRGSVVVAALLAVLLVTWAASIGPSGVLRGDGPGRRGRRPRVTGDQSASDGPTGPPRRAARQRPAPWSVRALAFVLNVAAVVLAIVLLALAALAGRARRRARAPAPPSRRRRRRAGRDFDVIEPRAAVARELLADAEAQRDALADGTPRNAVVACWHRFETHRRGRRRRAAARGRRRRSTPSGCSTWSTPTRPRSPGSRALYREARFSEHELTEADRAAAVEALDEIHRTIGVRAMSRAGGRRRLGRRAGGVRRRSRCCSPSPRPTRTRCGWRCWWRPASALLGLVLDALNDGGAVVGGRGRAAVGARQRRPAAGALRRTARGAPVGAHARPRAARPAGACSPTRCSASGTALRRDDPRGRARCSAPS